MKTYYLKLVTVVCMSAFIFSCATKEEQKQFTVAEYEAAAKHMDRGLYNLVYNQVSGSKFISKNQLIYSTKNKDGKKYILVNSDEKTKKEAFNHNKLAESLSKELDTDIEANALPLYDLSFSEDLKSINFTTYRQKFNFNIGCTFKYNNNGSAKSTNSISKI